MKAFQTLIATAKAAVLLSTSVIAQEDSYLDPAAKKATEIMNLRQARKVKLTASLIKLITNCSSSKR